MLKKAIQRALRCIGYELKRAHLDAFHVQQKVITTHEPLIVDVGAHVGSVALEYRELFPHATIHCFEPFPLSYQELQHNVGGDARICCHPFAVSDKEGTDVLNANLSSATNSLLLTDKRGSSYWGEGLFDTTSQVEIDTTTIDVFTREKGILNVDILKLDVQGLEYAVLNGAKDMLSNQRVSLIYTELILGPSYQKQHKLHEYLTLLDSFGYHLLDIYTPIRHRHQLIQADFIFLSSSLKEALEA